MCSMAQFRRAAFKSNTILLTTKWLAAETLLFLLVTGFPFILTEQTFMQQYFYLLHEIGP